MGYSGGLKWDDLIFLYGYYVLKTIITKVIFLFWSNARNCCNATCHGLETPCQFSFYHCNIKVRPPHFDNRIKVLLCQNIFLDVMKPVQNDELQDYIAV